MKTALTVAAFAASASTVQAQSSPSVLRACPSSDVCFSLSIPSTTAQSGSGSIYFQMQAPTTNSWVALGQGTRMVGSNMFVMYQNADGTNVTVSPRKVPRYTLPTYDSSVQLTVLAGSGVSNGMMTANVRCDGCSSWNGGSMDYGGSSSSWIYAIDAGTPIKSNSLTEPFGKHDSHGNFDFATQQAIGAASSNPFVSAASTNPSSGSSAPSGTAPGTSGSTTTPNVVSNPFTPSNGSSASSIDRENRLLMAHAVLATVAFVALFPLGALLMRVGRMGRERLWIHSGIQLLAYMVFIAGASIGIYIAGTEYIMTAHAIIGLFLLAFVFFMPFAGYYHHVLFKRQGRRTLIGRAHSYAGRIAILLGMVNGGLGLQLVGQRGAAVIAYGVVAGVVGVAYIAMIVWWEVAGSKKAESRIVEKGSPRGDRPRV